MTYISGCYEQELLDLKKRKKFGAGHQNTRYKLKKPVNRELK